MNNKFDELAKTMAQSVTRRGALKKFGAGLAGIALATLGFPGKAEARNCNHCIGPYFGCAPSDGACIQDCAHHCLKKLGGGPH